MLSLIAVSAAFVVLVAVVASSPRQSLQERLRHHTRY
jgi:hypothetical protein